MLIITIASCRIEAGNLNSQPNNKKCGEKDERKTCYSSCNNHGSYKSHGNYKSHSQVWPLWRPYFCKLGFTIYIIHLTNPFASWWSHKVIWWSSAFTQFLEFPIEFCTLANENFGWSPKPIKYLVQKCICCPFIGTIWQQNQLQTPSICKPHN